MHEALAVDCLASRNRDEMETVMTFLRRYGHMIKVKDYYGKTTLNLEEVIDFMKTIAPKIGDIFSSSMIQRRFRTGYTNSSNEQSDKRNGSMFRFETMCGTIVALKRAI